MRGAGHESAIDAGVVAIAQGDAQVDAQVRVTPPPAAPIDAAPVPTIALVDASMRAVSVDARGRRRSADARGAAVDAIVEAVPGTIQISSRPWAVVTVMGRSERCDETPCKLVLPPGTYTLVLRNPQARLEKMVSVDVTSAKTVQVKETLTR